MFRTFIGFTLFAAFLAMLLGGCASTRQEPRTDDYRKRIAALNSKLLVNPNNAEALRDLGITYFEMKLYDIARWNLRKSIDIDDRDPKAKFFYGMALEYENNPKAALAVYINYSDYPPGSEYRKLMEGRYHQLTRDVIQQQFQELLQNEQRLTGKELSPLTLAVFPLLYQGADDRYSALSKGISEMVITDLGQVERLSLVERIRVEALLEELQFGQSAAVDPSTAPRLGKLLSAGRLIAGSFSLSVEKQLTINLASWDAIKRESPQITTGSEALDNLFRLEKDLVFSILDKFGIAITLKEREDILRVPTRNMQAFLLYSLGLEKEDARDFKAASVFFNQAISLDPQFAPAKTRAQTVEALSLAGGPKENALAVATKTTPAARGESPTKSKNLVTNRLQNLSNGIGTNFYPGQDDRKPAQAAGAAGILGGQLQLPPPPPSR